MHYSVLIILLMLLPQESFKSVQLKKARVKTAYEEKEQVVKNYFIAQKLKYEGFHLFIRGFKQEAKVEVWVKEKSAPTYSLLHVYDFCAMSGGVGPKRKEGDLQIPEGIYYINHFNPESSYHLSLGLNYPNASDKILSDKKSPGSAIYIHGNCVTIGCIPITDDKIKELYILALESRNNGQEKTPVHIFPARLSDANLILLNRQMPQHSAFWKNLKTIYDDFETKKMLSGISVNKGGQYVLDPTVAVN
jgi:murein L,D-transpeptidase YafK